MALVICPECQEKISQYSEKCIHCGFPIQKFLIDNHLDDFEHFKICPKCGNTEGIVPDLLPVRLKCKFCGTQVVQTDLTEQDINQLVYIKDESETINERAKRIYGDIANKYGGNRFSPEEYDTWTDEVMNRHTNDNSSKQHNQPKCPTCGSTNIKKITATQKASNAVLFGLFGNKRKKQFHCNNCGYEW